MNSEDDESILNCLAEFEHSEINLSVETERILKNEKFNKDVKTVLMTCLGCLFSEKLSDGENRDEEETFNKDVKTVLMTCLGCLSSEKLSHGENRDEEETFNKDVKTVLMTCLGCLFSEKLSDG